MRDLGYETYSSVLNLGTLFIFLIVYFLKVLYLCVLWVLSLVSKKFKYKVKKLQEKLFFNELLAIALEAYLEFLISGYLNIEAQKKLVVSDAPWYKNGDIISKYASYFCLFLAVVFIPGV